MAKNGDTDWAGIIYRGVESEDLDYKAAQNWHALGRAGKAKFVRHSLALANTKGGYIVIGVGEDPAGKPALFTGLTEAQLKSFDPTEFGNFLNRYADPAVDFDLEKPTVDGKHYVVLVIRRFADLPHVCTTSCEGELQQGAFYIRTQDAASRIAYRASELHDIVQRALRNQREVLGRMIRGVLYESRYDEAGEENQVFLEQARTARAFFDKRVLGGRPAGHVVLGVTAYPPQYVDERFSLSEIREAVVKSVYNFRDLPFAAMGDDDETYFTNVALRSCLHDKQIFWQAWQSGMFAYLCAPANGSKAVSYTALTHLVAEAVFFLAQFYAELGYEEDVMTLGFELSGVEGVRLHLPPSMAERQKYVCRIERIRLQKKRSAADLASGVVDHSTRILREICERFNFPAGKHGGLRDRLHKHLQRQP